MKRDDLQQSNGSHIILPQATQIKFKVLTPFTQLARRHDDKKIVQ